MITEPELLNERLERLAMVLDEIMPNCASLVRDALELLKEQQKVIEQYHKAVFLMHMGGSGTYLRATITNDVTNGS